MFSTISFRFCFRTTLKTVRHHKNYDHFHLLNFILTNIAKKINQHNDNVRKKEDS